MAAIFLVGGLVVYCAVISYIYPRITRWLFKRYHEGTVQFIYVLVMVFLASELAVTIGIEGVFGAFFAGIVLNRYIPARSPLMSRLEFVGNAIFIPYFLIGVGMLINIRVLFSGWTTVYVATVMSVLAMTGKYAVLHMRQKLG